MNIIEIRTKARQEFVDLTADVERIVAASGVASGVCVVTAPHTTAGVTVNENADPDVRADLAMTLRQDRARRAPLRPRRRELPGPRQGVASSARR